MFRTVVRVIDGHALSRKTASLIDISPQFAGKRLEQLKEAVPEASTIAVLDRPMNRIGKSSTTPLKPRRLLFRQDPEGNETSRLARRTADRF